MKSILVTVALFILSTCIAAHADEIVIFTGLAGHDPGYTELAALYESEYPGTSVVITDEWSQVVAHPLTIMSLTGYHNPNVQFDFEMLIQLAIHWSDDKRLVLICDAHPPYVPDAFNGLLNLMEVGLQIAPTSLGAECGNATQEINVDHETMVGITELYHGSTSSVGYLDPATWLFRTADGSATIGAIGDALGFQADPCNDVVVICDSSVLSDECGALAHPGNRQLARNLYENCAGAVPVEPGTWGAVKGLYR